MFHHLCRWNVKSTLQKMNYMKKFLIWLNHRVKDMILMLRPSFFFGWSKGFFCLVANTLSLSQWISRQNKKNIEFNDFLVVKEIIVNVRNCTNMW
jgi:hypothetical protein